MASVLMFSRHRVFSLGFLGVRLNFLSLVHKHISSISLFFLHNIYNESSFLHTHCHLPKSSHQECSSSPISSPSITSALYSHPLQPPQYGFLIGILQPLLCPAGHFPYSWQMIYSDKKCHQVTCCSRNPYDTHDPHALAHASS